MGKSSTETQTQSIDPRVAAQRDAIYNATKALPGYQAYGGERVAGLDPNTLAGYQRLMQGDPQLQKALSGLVSNLGLFGSNVDVSQFYNPYQNDVINAVKGDFAHERSAALDQVGAGAVAAGAFGGTRHGIAEGQALGDIARAEASTIAGIRQGGYNTALQAALQNRATMGNLGLSAAGLLNLYNQQGATAQIALGDVQRGIQQQGYDTGFEEFMRQQQAPYQRVGLLQGYLASAPYGTTSTTKSSGNFWSGVGGALGLGASYLPSSWFKSGGE